MVLHCPKWRFLLDMDDFNTSNVMVLLLAFLVCIVNGDNFNTSNVMVLQLLERCIEIAKNISIHLMLWFFFRLTSFTLIYLMISIHLMLWFFVTIWLAFCTPCNISIHLMLWFFSYPYHRTVCFIFISIHLMLWFFSQRSKTHGKEKRFQYI